MLDKIQLENALKGIVLLLLSIFGNFIAETFGCQAQKFLSENMFAKHITVVFITFLQSAFPKKRLYIRFHSCTTLLVYVLFVLFTRMSFTFRIVFCLVVHIILTIRFSTTPDWRRLLPLLRNPV